jgi:hypothetical protein
MGLRDGDIDLFLQRVYRFEIPDKVGEASAEGQITFTPVIGTDAYTFSTISEVPEGDPVLLIRGITGPLHLMNTSPSELDLYSNPKEFYNLYPTVTNADPLAALVYGRTLRLRPVPTATTQIRVHGLFYRDEFPEAGIELEPEAWCAVHGAVHLYASETGSDDIETRFDAKFKMDLAEVASAYAGNFRKSSPPGDRW